MDDAGIFEGKSSDEGREGKGDKRGSGWCQNSVESGWMTSGPGGAEWMQGWTAVDLAPAGRPIGLRASRFQLPMRLRLGVFQSENLGCPLIPSDTYRGGGIRYANSAAKRPNHRQPRKTCA